MKYFLAQIKGRNQGDRFIDDDGLFVGDVKLGIGPLDVDAVVLEEIVGSSLARSPPERFGLSMTRTSTPAVFAIHHRLQKSRLGEGELLDEEGFGGGADEISHRPDAIVGFNDQ